MTHEVDPLNLDVQIKRRIRKFFHINSWVKYATEHDHTYCRTISLWSAIRDHNYCRLHNALKRKPKSRMRSLRIVEPPPIPDDPKLLKCKQCSFHTTSVVFLNQHLFTLHIKPKRHPPPLVLKEFKDLLCHDCGFKSVSPRVFNWHFKQCKAKMKNSKILIKWYKCPKCPYKTEKGRELKNHYCDTRTDNK